MPVDGPGQFAADVGVGHGLAPRGQQVSVCKGGHPTLPVFPPHHLYRGSHFLFRCGLEVEVVDLALIHIQGFNVEALPHGLDHAAPQHPRIRILAHRGGQAIHNQIHRASVLQGPHDLVLQGVRERVPLQRLGPEAGRLRGALEGAVAVVARAGRFAFRGRLFKGHAKGFCPGPEGRRDARSKTIARGAAQHEHALGAVL